MRKADKQMRMKQPLINTGLQPGVGGRRMASAVSTVSRAHRKAAKAAGRSLSRRVTGLKPGVNETKYLEITGASYVAGNKLLLTFNDGAARVVDFGPFLAKARNPDTIDYRDLKKFKSFHLQDGDLIWGDFQMIFPNMDLYRGTILKGEEAEPAYFAMHDAVARSSRLAKASTSVSCKKTKLVGGVLKREKVLHHV